MLHQATISCCTSNLNPPLPTRVEKSISVTEMRLCAVLFVAVNAISLSVRCSIVIYDRIDIWIALDVTVQHFHSTCPVWGGTRLADMIAGGSETKVDGWLKD